MAEPTCDHDDTIDLGGNAIDWTRVSAEFGEEAFCVACPCGSWVVESASGEILARSGSAGAPRPALGRAA